MKNIYLFLTLALVTTLSHTVFSQNTSDTNPETSALKPTVEVYYFHNTRRCATCNAVEQVTLETLKDNYSERLASGDITFQSLNIEEKENEPLASQLGVSGQTLLIIKGGKKTDLTNDAFMYARTKPEKLKEKVQKTIDAEQ